MDSVIAALRDEAKRARQAAVDQHGLADRQRDMAKEAAEAAQRHEAYAQECEAAIARLSPTPSAAAA